MKYRVSPESAMMFPVNPQLLLSGSDSTYGTGWYLQQTDIRVIWSSLVGRFVIIARECLYLKEYFQVAVDDCL